MNDELLRALSDLAYARASFFRQNTRYHLFNMNQFLTNEAWLLTLLSRFPIQQQTNRRPQLQVRRRLDFNSASNILDSLFPENINIEEFLQSTVNIHLNDDQLGAATHPWTAPAGSTEICCLCQDNLVGSLCIETSCNHHLHEECSRDLFLHFSVKCPVCRADLREARPTNTNGPTTPSSSMHTNIQS